jgi:PAS domain S-box-containing protein
LLHNQLIYSGEFLLSKGKINYNFFKANNNKNIKPASVPVSAPVVVASSNISRDSAFLKSLADYNAMDARLRVDGLKAMGMIVEDDEVLRVLTKSHFVIPGVTRWECQNCGECCRYAQKIATFTYQSCAFLTDKNMCSKHENRYLVCRWFPFWVYYDPKFGPLLTIKPYCSGYGRGELVDYDVTMAKMMELSSQTAIEDDGAFVIHELLHLPGSKEWAFPSKENVDKLLKLLSENEAKNVTNNSYNADLIDGVNYAHHYTSGLLGNITDPHLTVNEDGVISDVNNAFCKLCGKDRESLISRKLSSLFVNSMGAATDIQTSFYRGKITAVPHRIKLADTTVPVLFNAMTYRGRLDGQVHGSLVCIKEVTDIIYNELAQSKNYTRGLIDASLDAFMVINLDGTIMDVNEAFVNITGCSREQLIGDYFNNHFANPEEAKKGVDITFKAGQVKNFELDLKTVNNETIPVSFNASVFNNHEGVIQGIFAVARDIRENRKIMKQLEDAKNYARGLIESSIDLMVTINCDGVVTDVNEAAVELTGYPREKLINSLFQKYFTDPKRAFSGVEMAFGGGKVKDYQLELINIKSEKIPVSFNANVYKNSEGTVLGVFAIARDLRKMV